MDATTCKEEGNAAMGRGDYVNAMKWYSQALALNPKEAALYSNRSFAFLRLGLTNRALTDANEAAKRRSDWSKAHFRLAEALSQAGLHQDALRSYELGCRCDPADEHLRKQCVEAKARLEAQSKAETMRVAVGATVGAVLLGLLLMAPAAEPDKPAGVGGMPRAPPPAGSVVTALSNFFGLLMGVLLGAAAGAGSVQLQRHSRKGAALPPLQSNEHFAAMQMHADVAEAGGAAGPLRSRVLEQGDGPAVEPRQAASSAVPPHAGGGAAGGAKPDAAASNAKGHGKVRSTANGRAAALKAMAAKKK